MGDTGSLALGGLVAGLSIVTRTELLLVVIGGLFVVETLSVVIQIAVFKTRTARVFKMAPFHHHFELAGWAETTVIVRFWLLAAMSAALGLGLFYTEWLAATGGLSVSCAERCDRRPAAGGAPVLVAGRRRLRAAPAVGGAGSSSGARVTGRRRPRRRGSPTLPDRGATGRRRPDALPAGTDLVVTSPGWRPDHPLLAAARAAGVEVIGEVELAWRLGRRPAAGRPRARGWR